MRTADLEVGLTLGPGSWRELDQRQLSSFGEVTDDTGWLHVDPERARSGPYGGTIASAWHLLALMPAFARELIQTTDSTTIVYGLGRARFPAPAPVDSRIRASAAVTDRAARGEQTQLTVSFTIEREGGEKPVCVVDVIYLLTPRS